ncbi:hypothetical protein K438DRAFT_1930637 [Mycena galopus ATCC 62051]|nr:hypothetical protein K438DRAFT_1930637 [Mycena galopus ATCC 62051]
MLLPILQPRNTDNENPPTSINATTWVRFCSNRRGGGRVKSVVNSRMHAQVLAFPHGSDGKRCCGGLWCGTSPRELTAEQLAGSINQAPGAPTRRPRRARRTPSQISTVSLPAYMKEPGEQELVVSRGPDGEDVAMPAASAIEDDEDQSNEGHQSSEDHDHDDSNVPNNSHYSPMPQSPHDTPLLGSDPRGDAPAYFEVLEPAGEDNYPPGISVAPPEPEDAAPQRRSGFFSMFRSAPPAVPVPVASPSNDTEPTRLALTHTRTRSTTAPAPSTRHRASNSTSTLFSLGRKKSTTSLSANNLTSPSLISLASISHPLPHTLVKTEFSALPKGGLTAEQLSLISGSKEGGLGRFGVPWGAAAVAYANASASTSRVALGENGEAPPPGWEEVSGLPSGSGAAELVASASASGSGSGSAEAEPEASASAEPEAREEHDTPTSPPAERAPTRAESRASGMSMQSFATAEEAPSDDEHGDEDEHAGSQFRVHVQEPTDATIRP